MGRDADGLPEIFSGMDNKGFASAGLTARPMHSVLQLAINATFCV